MSSEEDLTIQGKANRSFNEDGKTLSKNALYAPLMAYDQTKTEPSKFMIAQSSVPKSLQESALINFLHKTSFNYHRFQAKPSDPKNNGSRPMSAADISERIRQKAVTLVGGGINSSITSTTKSEATKLRKRRRQEWTDVESALNYGIETTAENEKSPGGDDAIRFLLQLNSSWNKYISDLLKITEVSEDELTTVKSRFISARSKVELIGAHVRVATCNQKKHLVNSYGVIIGETKNTWKIVAREVLKQSRKRAKPEDEDSQSDAKNGINCKVIVLPKRGSSLVLIIPIISSLSKGDSEVLCGGDGEQNHQLIAKSEKSLRITLDPNLNEEY